MQRFVHNWAYPNYVHLKALKRYASDIPNTIKAQYEDIIVRQKDFEK